MPQEEMIRELRELGASRRKITADMIILVSKIYPVGSTIHFRKWGRDITATVVENDLYYERFIVKSHTGNVYRIDFYDVFGYL